jgi:hypothetical protein
MDLLATHKHDSELQVITAISLISTLYKSPQHPTSLFQPAVFSPAFLWQRFLAMDILQLHALTVSCAELSFQLTTDNSTNWVPGWRPFHTNFPVFSSQADFQLTTNWVAPVIFRITSRHGPHRKHHCFHNCSPTVAAT